MKYLTFLIESSENDEKHYKTLIIGDQEAPVISIKHNERGRLKSLLQSLAGNTKFYVLFHLGGRDSINDRFRGEYNLDNFKIAIPGLEIKENRYYFSSGNNTIDEGLVVSSSEVPILGTYAGHPKPLTPYALLFNNTSIKDYEYSLGGNKYNQWLFEQSVKEEIIKQILGNTLPQQAEQIEIKVLTPGFSGAQVIEVQYLVENSAQALIVKMDRNKNSLEQELVFAKQFGHRPNLSINYVVTSDQELRQVEEWYILKYDRAQQSQQLKDLLGKTNDIKRVKKIYANFITSITKDFLTTFGGIKILKNKSCWVSKNEKEYEGLTIWPSTQKGIIREINFIIDKFEHKVSFEKGSVNFLIEFIKTGKYRGVEIDDQSYVPVGRVHGDMHTGNILTKDGEYFQVIDFAFSSESNKHAFLDLAKLAVDTEMNIISDSLFILNKNTELHLKNWIEYHEAWLESEGSWSLDEEGQWMKLKTERFSTLSKSVQSDFFKAYEINKFILDATSYIIDDNLIDMFDSKRLNNVLKRNLQIQFLLTRLHYLLKYISYSNIILEKRLFAIKASLSILNKIQPLA